MLLLCFWSDQPSLQLLWILYKIDLMLENLWRMQEILILGNLGLNSCFWKSYHHILIHFVPQCQCFELFLNVFSKTVFFFPQTLWASVHFDWSNLIFDQSKLFWNCFKFFKEPLSVSIDRNWFSINRNSWIRFKKKKKIRFNLFKPFFQNFSKLFLSLRLGKAPQRFFCRFLLHKSVCPYYPSFCIVFHDFMHYFMVFG